MHDIISHLAVPVFDAAEIATLRTLAAVPKPRLPSTVGRQLEHPTLDVGMLDVRRSTLDAADTVTSGTRYLCISLPVFSTADSRTDLTLFIPPATLHHMDRHYCFDESPCTCQERDRVRLASLAKRSVWSVSQLVNHS